MAKKKTKTKIKIQGKNFMIPEEVKKSIEFLSEIIRAHEVALLTWVHKIHNEKAFNKADIELLKKEMYKYTMRIPNAKEILENMQKIDERAREDLEAEKKEKKKQKNEPVKKS
jgi:GTPase involved in cell partitioning and DNA repair